MRVSIYMLLRRPDQSRSGASNLLLASECFLTLKKRANHRLKSIESFKSTIGASGSVSEISTKEFDPRGDYKQILKKVDHVTTGGVKIFRVEGGGTRVEYFVVGISKEGTALVGLKAKAIES